MRYLGETNVYYNNTTLPNGSKYLIRHNLAFPTNQDTLHYHDHYEAFYVVSGTTTYTTGKNKYKLLPGSLLLIPPYEKHQLFPKNNTALERIAIRFSAKTLKDLSTLDADLENSFNPESENYISCITLTENQQKEMLHILQGLLRETQDQAFASTLAAKTYLIQFLVLVNRITLESCTPEITPNTSKTVSLSQNIIEYVNEHYTQPITLDMLEKRFNINKYQISREFSKAAGCPLHKYLVQKRLARSILLLKDGHTAQETALECGFSDYSSFYRQFRAAYGVSPRAYSLKQFHIT